MSAREREREREREYIFPAGYESDDNKKRKSNKHSVLPIEFVKLLSDYLTSGDLSKKNAISFMIKIRF